MYNLLGLYEREPEKSIYNLKFKIELSCIAFCVVKGGLQVFKKKIINLGGLQFPS